MEDMESFPSDTDSSKELEGIGVVGQVIGVLPLLPVIKAASTAPDHQPCPPTPALELSTPPFKKERSLSPTLRWPTRGLGCNKPTRETVTD